MFKDSSSSIKVKKCQEIANTIRKLEQYLTLRQRATEVCVGNPICSISSILDQHWYNGCVKSLCSVSKYRQYRIPFQSTACHRQTGQEMLFCSCDLDLLVHMCLVLRPVLLIDSTCMFWRCLWANKWCCCCCWWWWSSPDDHRYTNTKLT